MDIQLEEQEGVRIAIEGCGHGTLHAIYASIDEACKQKGWPSVDLLIIGGDFQSVRNAFDLNCVSMPAKYRDMCDFHEYYSGQRTAPYLTIFAGGNHEASNYLFELYYGGWVAPNIYYMGAANVLRLGPLRIAGMTGIWKGFDYRKPHFERLPYNESDLRSIYHVREMDVRKLLQICTQVDIGISHDWPQGVEWKGNWKQLFRFKKHFEEDARTGRLGSIAAKQVLDRLRPTYWFSAHLHCKYAAIVAHGTKQEAQKRFPEAQGMSSIKPDANGFGLSGHETEDKAPVQNENEIDLDMDDVDDTPPESALGLSTTPATAVSKSPANADEIDLEMDDLDEDAAEPDSKPPAKAHSILEPAQQQINPVLAQARAALPDSFARPKSPERMEHPPDITNSQTNFLALDKCLPKRHFLQLTEIPLALASDHVRPLKLRFDPEWLAITRAFALSEQPVFGDPDFTVPTAKSQADYRALITEQQTWVDNNLSDPDLIIPENFEITAPVYDGGDFRDAAYQQVMEYPNPQTARFCHLLQIPNPLQISPEQRAARMEAGPRPDLDTGFRGGRGGRGRGGRGRGARGHRGRSGGGGRFRGR